MDICTLLNIVKGNSILLPIQNPLKSGKRGSHVLGGFLWLLAAQPRHSQPFRRHRPSNFPFAQIEFKGEKMPNMEIYKLRKHVWQSFLHLENLKHGLWAYGCWIASLVQIASFTTVTTPSCHPLPVDPVWPPNSTRDWCQYIPILPTPTKDLRAEVVLIGFRRYIKVVIKKITW